MSMFQQYQSGIQGVQGIAEAGANIGKFAQQGMQEFGKSLATGIQEYNKNYALDEQATQEGHQVAQQLAFYHQMAAMSPENAPLLPMLDEQVKTLQKLPSMSLTQKLGALNGAKSALSQFGQNLQLNQLMQQQRTANALDEFKPEGKNVDAMSAILDNTPFDPSLSPQQNIDTHLRKGIESAKANGFNVKPDNEVIAAYLSDVKGKLDTAVDVNGKPIDAQTKASFAEQLDRYKNFTEGKTEQGYSRFSNGLVIDENGMLVPAPDMETVGTYNALTKSVDEYTKPEAPTAEKIAEFKPTDEPKKNVPLLTALQKFDTAKSSLVDEIGNDDKDIKDLNQQIADMVLREGKSGTKDFTLARQHRDELIKRRDANKEKLSNLSESDFQDDVAPKDTRSLEQIAAEGTVAELKPKIKLQADIAKVGDNIIKGVRTMIEDNVRSGKPVTALEVGQYLDDQEEAQNPTVKRRRPFMGDSTDPDIVTFGQKSDAQTRWETAIKKLGIDTSKPLSSAQAYSLIKELDVQSAEAGKKAEQAQQAVKDLKPSAVPVGVQTAQKAPEKRLGGITTSPIAVGSKEVTSDLTLEQKKEQAKQWFRENKQFGYIPSSFNSVWEQQHPESKLQVVTASNGMQFYSDGKGEWKPVPIEKGHTMSPEEQAKYAGRIYQGEEIAGGTGIRVSGVITGDDPTKFKTEMTHAGSAIKQIDALLEILQRNNGRSFSPEQRAEAEKYVAFLKSMTRGQLFPSGRVAEWEQIVLDKIVPNPTAIFSLDSSTLKGLNILRQQAVDNIKDNAVNRGLQVHFNTAPKVSALAQEARQARAINRPK